MMKDSKYSSLSNSPSILKLKLIMIFFKLTLLLASINSTVKIENQKMMMMKNQKGIKVFVMKLF
jgi:hypothetical protein